MTLLRPAFLAGAVLVVAAGASPVQAALPTSASPLHSRSATVLTDTERSNSDPMVELLQGSTAGSWAGVVRFANCCTPAN
jgi:hypothetical protein